MCTATTKVGYTLIDGMEKEGPQLSATTETKVLLGVSNK